MLQAQPYNFYTFPQIFKNKFNKDIAINNDCISFHETVGTDFQRWLFKGVNYFQNYSMEAVEKMVFGIDTEDKEPSDYRETFKLLTENEKIDFTEIEGVYETFIKGAEKVKMS